MAVVARKRARGTVYFVVTQGHWERAGTDAREADRLDARRKREVKAGTFKPGGGTGAQKVSTYAETWLDKRKVKAADTEAQLVRDYVLAVPWFANMRMDEVRPRHVIKLAGVLHEVPPVSGCAPTLSKKTVANIFGILKTMFRDAVIDEVILSQPVVLPRGTLSRKGKRRSPYDVENVRKLLAGARRHEARVFAAEALYTGQREGEVCGRRWRNWDRNSRPLGCLTVDTQYDNAPLKTDNPRRVPVHPELAALLQWWWDEGWELLYRRPPTQDDFIVPPPRTPDRCYTMSGAYKLWRQLLAEAGVTNLSLHSTRHTFVSLCRRGGARKDVVECITHNASGEMIDQYTHWDWAPLCEAVMCLPSLMGAEGLAASSQGHGATPRGSVVPAAGGATSATALGCFLDSNAVDAPAGEVLDSRLTASREQHESRLRRLDSNTNEPSELTEDDDVCRLGEGPDVPVILREGPLTGAEPCAGQGFPARTDAIAELFDLLREAGAKPTLYGKPVTEGELRRFALASAAERVGVLPL